MEIKISNPFIHVKVHFYSGKECLPEVDMYLTEAQKKQFDKYINNLNGKRKRYAPKFFTKAVLAAGYKIDKNGMLFYKLQ